MRKRILSLFLAVLFLFTTIIPHTSVQAEVEKVTTPDDISQQLPGTGTETDPWMLEDDDSLSAFLSLANERGGFSFKGYFVSMGNDLYWGKAWTGLKKFEGTFDGQGHSILFAHETDTSFLMSDEGENIGFFGTTNSAVIKNVTFDHPEIKYGSNKNIGTVIGNAINTKLSNVKVTNGKIDEIENASGIEAIGGLVGTSSSLTIENCSYSGSIVAGGTEIAYGIGGIVGYAVGTCNIYSSVSSGSINYGNRKPAWSNIGGIVGKGNCNVTNSTGIVIQNSNNIMNISGRGIAGGIVGIIEYQAIDYGGQESKIYQCQNSGNIISECSGGIVGQSTGLVKINQSYNKGSIDGNQYAGGICGFIGNNSWAEVEIIDDYNVGNVVCRDGYSGGIVGCIISGTCSSTKIANCFFYQPNTDIDTKYGVAARLAFAGWAFDGATFENIYYPDGMKEYPDPDGDIDWFTVNNVKCLKSWLKYIDRNIFVSAKYDFDNTWKMGKYYPLLKWQSDQRDDTDSRLKYKDVFSFMNMAHVENTQKEQRKCKYYLEKDYNGAKDYLRFLHCLNAHDIQSVECAVEKDNYGHCAGMAIESILSYYGITSPVYSLSQEEAQEKLCIYQLHQDTWTMKFLISDFGIMHRGQKSRLEYLIDTVDEGKPTLFLYRVDVYDEEKGRYKNEGHAVVADANVEREGDIMIYGNPEVNEGETEIFHYTGFIHIYDSNCLTSIGQNADDYISYGKPDNKKDFSNSFLYYNDDGDFVIPEWYEKGKSWIKNGLKINWVTNHTFDFDYYNYPTTEYRYQSYVSLDANYSYSIKVGNKTFYIDPYDQDTLDLIGLPYCYVGEKNSQIFIQLAEDMNSVEISPTNTEDTFNASVLMGNYSYIVESESIEKLGIESNGKLVLKNNKGEYHISATDANKKNDKFYAYELTGNTSNDINIQLTPDGMTANNLQNSILSASGDTEKEEKTIAEGNVRVTENGIEVENNKATQEPPVGIFGDEEIIKGTTPAMEYRMVGNEDWTTCSDGTTEVEPGDYEVRMKETDELAASDPITVTVTKKDSGQEETDEEILNRVSGGAEKITGTNENMEYSPSNSDEWKSCKEGSTEAEPGEYKVRLKATESKPASDPVIVIVTKKVNDEDRPSDSKDALRNVSGGEEKILGTTTNMEYSPSGLNAWSDCSDTETQVRPGKYDVRIKATDNTEASASIRVTVRKIKTAEESKKTIHPDTLEKEEQHTHHYEWKVIREATEEQDGEIDYLCSDCGEVEYRSMLSSFYVFNRNLSESIRQCWKNGTLVVDATKRGWISFSSMVLQALKDRPDVMLQLKYSYKGSTYEMLIPAGQYDELKKLFDKSSVKDSQGNGLYCGYLNLATKYPAKKVK